jgi:hypothetical protein
VYREQQLEMKMDLKKRIKKTSVNSKPQTIQTYIRITKSAKSHLLKDN